MAKQLFANNAKTTVVGYIAIGQTAITVADASNFPTITVGSDDYFHVTLFEEALDGEESKHEIIKVTATADNNWTVVRNVEGLSTPGGYAYPATTHVELRWTAGAADNFVQTDGFDITGGSMADVAITGGTITGTPIESPEVDAANLIGGTFQLTGDTVQVAEGGTGASTAANARTNLGLVIGTNVQAQNANLQSLAGQNLAADRLIYASGPATISQAQLTSFGRSLIDDSDAATARTTLGLVIGTNVQAQDAALQSIANLNPAAGNIIYTTATDTFAIAPITAFGRSLIDDADAAAARATLGISTTATTAEKLATARTISLSGDVTGSVFFDGSQNVSITSTVADDSHNHVVSNIDGLQTALDAKAASWHTHVVSNIDGLQTALDAKAASWHTHSNYLGTDVGYDAVGSFCLARTSASASISSGSTVAGSSLRPVSLNSASYSTASSSLSGTWRNLGHTVDTENRPISLFQRIS